MFIRVFWILFSLEAAAFVVLMLWSLFGSPSWGPEGPVGAWLLFVVPPLMLGVPLAVFLLGKSAGAKLTAILLLALPLLQAVLGPLYSAFEDYQTRRRVEGDASFTKPAARQLAHALRAHDATLVKSLLPQVGDLNAPHRGGESLLRFCMTNLDKSQASLEIVRAMLAAGANAKDEMAGGTWPLWWGIDWGPAMTELLLDAGADPNTLDAGKPLWWEAFEGSFSDEKLRMLKILLDRGADMTLRYGENGPVGWAANRKHWPSVWLMIQRGAAWKDERSFGTPMPQVLAWDLESRRGAREQVPDELLKLIELYNQQASR
jgi:hypothetical protein